MARSSSVEQEQQQKDNQKLLLNEYAWNKGTVNGMHKQNDQVYTAIQQEWVSKTETQKQTKRRSQRKKEKQTWLQ